MANIVMGLLTVFHLAYLGVVMVKPESVTNYTQVCTMDDAGNPVEPCYLRPESGNCILGRADTWVRGIFGYF